MINFSYARDVTKNSLINYTFKEYIIITTNYLFIINCIKKPPSL